MSIKEKIGLDIVEIPASLNYNGDPSEKNTILTKLKQVIHKSVLFDFQIEPGARTSLTKIISNIAYDKMLSYFFNGHSSGIRQPTFFSALKQNDDVFWVFVSKDLNSNQAYNILRSDYDSGLTTNKPLFPEKDYFSRHDEKINFLTMYTVSLEKKHPFIVLLEVKIPEFEAYYAKKKVPVSYFTKKSIPTEDYFIKTSLDGLLRD